MKKKYLDRFELFSNHLKQLVWVSSCISSKTLFCLWRIISFHDHSIRYRVFILVLYPQPILL